MIIIGITGKKKSGKDTVYEIIKNTLTVPCCKVAFADELKKEIAEACNIDVEFIERHKDRFRTIMQWWGTDFRRTMCGANYWIDKVVEQIVHIPPSVKVVCITDVRFYNESIFLRRYNGHLIKVRRTFDSTSDTHPSETELDSIPANYIIDNDGSLDDLKIKVVEVIDKINKIYTPKDKIHV